MLFNNVKVLLALIFSVSIAFSFRLNEEKLNEENRIRVEPEKDSSSFKIYVFPDRYGEKAKVFFRDNGILSATLQTQGAIVSPGKDVVNHSKVSRFLAGRFPDVNDTGVVVLDWESGPYKQLMYHNADEQVFKEAAQKWIDLIREVKRQRPNLKVGVYGMPFRAFNDWQKNKFNQPGKLTDLLREVDFIAPSLYILYPDEQIGHKRNLQYLKDNLDFALAYGKELDKPVIPFVWHRIHGSNKAYGNDIIPKKVFTEYVDYIASYSSNGYMASGVFWYDYSQRSDQLKGLDKINNPFTYDSLIVAYTTTLLEGLK